MKLWDKLANRDTYPLSLDAWASFFTYMGNSYPLSGLNQSMQGNKEEIQSDFPGYVQGGFRGNTVVFSCEMVRVRVFSEARFQFRELNQGQPGALFRTQRRANILDHPWPGGTTGDLLSRMLLDADLAGNSFTTIRGGQIRRMRPDWVTIVLGSMTRDNVAAVDLDAELVGYIYHPGGRHSGLPVEILTRDQVCHFAPVPDPIAHYRGMSWLTPVIREVLADGAATSHKLKFFENAATPNMVVKMDPAISPETFARFIEQMKTEHEGAMNAYKTLYLAGGADVTTVGANMQQMDFKITQGAGETRIAAAAGVPPVIVGLSEGLQAATYSNYGQARRAFGDETMRPLWRNVCGSLATLVSVPANSELWYDDRDIPFLQEDQKDVAAIQQVNAITIRQLIEAGYKADAVIQAVVAGDMSLLEGEHTGLFSVQLQAPGAPKMPGGEVPGEAPVGPGTAPEKAPAGLPAKPQPPRMVAIRGTHDELDDVEAILRSLLEPEGVS